MIIAPPLYTLIAESADGPTGGYWRCALRDHDGCQEWIADDFEPEVHGERLELLAVVRGLEALRQPSRVSLVTPSNYVRRGLRYGLENWQESGWMWERYGEWVPVKNGDLWRRVSGALDFHHLVECRRWTASPWCAGDTSVARLSHARLDCQPADRGLAMAATG